jgi:glycosyltransferase involved in cell wall biosynthesis
MAEMPRALFLSPEAPYPPVGGGAMRSAALLDYLSRRFAVDVVTFADGVPGAAKIELPVHSRSSAARAWRNVRRFVVGRPPLLDRYSGFERELRATVGDRYDVAVVEHFWCAPYADVLRPIARRLILDLHNTESALARTVAACEKWPEAVLHRRFASCYERMERDWLPRFDAVLTTSEREATWVRACGGHAVVYPNTIPLCPAPDTARENAVVFTGNLEYHPNISAVRWFAREIWPAIRARRPDVEWRVVGKNPWAVAGELRGVKGAVLVGPVEDAVRELARAKVAAVPILAGSGTRFKILEAWCAGTAVVSTSLGAEGLECADGRDLVLADRPGEFAAAVVRLLDNPDQRSRLEASGRLLLERLYTVEAGWRALDQSGALSSV